MQRWQKILANGFGNAKSLCEFLEIPIPSDCQQSERDFATRVPRGFAMRMEKGNPMDPLLLQVLPQIIEIEKKEGFEDDPLAESYSNPISGIIHKYHGRLLVTFASACAVNCRYCFRRHFPYQENNPGRGGWEPVFKYISSDQSIHEVILSGGDPLLASDGSWKEFLEELVKISHVQTIRIHSRIPIVLPERMTDKWLQMLAECHLNKVLVLHTNHPNELDAGIGKALQGFKEIGGTLLNQSVLLKNVNDNAQTLVALSHRLFELGILPYYLHLLDKVNGSAHFEVDFDQARQIYTQMHRLLPGYLLPRLAREDSGRPGKTLFGLID